MSYYGDVKSVGLFTEYITAHRTSRKEKNVKNKKSRKTNKK